MKNLPVPFLVCMVALGGCSSSDDSGAAALASARSDFVTRCYAAFDTICEKGFSCNSFFMTSTYNSVQHCEDDRHQYIDGIANQQSSPATLSDCAHSCDTMKSDFSAIACQDFDTAAMKPYHCGS